jgi:hypothetical protein
MKNAYLLKHIYFHWILASFFYINPLCLLAQQTKRPMIWVKESEKSAILQKIKNNQWAKDYYSAFANRVQPELDNYFKEPNRYLSQLPFDNILQKPEQIPPFKTILNTDKDANAKRNKLQHFLKNAIDCGVLYYLTDDENYAQYATSVFYTFIKSMLQIKPSEVPFNGGWIYQDDHLREARELGAQIPIIYDFIYPYLQKGGKAYNFITQKQELVSVVDAEQVFKIYIDLALNRGIIDANWPVLESPSLVCNILALDKEQERLDYLTYYLEKNTPHQDALLKVAKVYKEGGNWPESINYSTAVTELTTYLMTLLTKVYPHLHLGIKYPEVLNAITVPYYLTYPNNNQNIIFGDSHRDFHIPFNNLEQAYILGQLEKSTAITKQFGSIIKSAIEDSTYNRSKLMARSYVAHPYFDEPLKLLWYSSNIEGDNRVYNKPVTNELPFAGILLQRNLSTTNNYKDALMSFVGGGAFVHGHASGMNMELFGQGYVLGSKGGRGEYGTEIHENYYRLFASHNTVIVNGASQGGGEWVNLAINRVKKIAIEPKPNEVPVSLNYSFITTGFLDDKGDSAEATLERTMGIIRTSPTTGFYVDVFKSKSTLPNQYHDYIYHNIGDQLDFKTNDKNFTLTTDEIRYQGSAAKVWKQNASYRNPGWHYFTKVETSGLYEKKMNALFTANSLEKQDVKMKLFIPESKGREYTKVMAPPSTESGKIYANQLTPTLIIRQNGEAWDRPFVVVYESFFGDKFEGSVQSVDKILQNGIFKGLIVNSIVNNRPIKQLIIIQSKDDDLFEDKNLHLNFKGRYAVVTLDENAALTELYIGSGSNFSFQKWVFRTFDNIPSSISTSIHNKLSINTSATKWEIKTPENYKVEKKIINHQP